MKVFRRETFNAAHRLFNPEWSDEKNLEVFGKCSNPNFHGHNYVLETCIEGPILQETGYVIDLKKLKTVTKNLFSIPLSALKIQVQRTLEATIGMIVGK